MSRIYVRPGDGRAVKKADRTWVPTGGEWLLHDTFVERRLRAGDLVRADAPAEAVDAGAPDRAVDAGAPDGAVDAGAPDGATHEEHDA